MLPTRWAHAVLREKHPPSGAARATAQSTPKLSDSTGSPGRHAAQRRALVLPSLSTRTRRRQTRNMRHSPVGRAPQPGGARARRKTRATCAWPPSHSLRAHRPYGPRSATRSPRRTTCTQRGIKEVFLMQQSTRAPLAPCAHARVDAPPGSRSEVRACTPSDDVGGCTGGVWRGAGRVPRAGPRCGCGCVLAECVVMW